MNNDRDKKSQHYKACPSCGSKRTILFHALQQDLWKSVCHECGFKSALTENYEKACYWQPRLKDAIQDKVNSDELL